GGLFRPGPAQLVQVGDNVILTNLLREGGDSVPVCAGRLHSPYRWREVMLHDGELSVREGGVYFTRYGGADAMKRNLLDEELQPTGPAPPATPLWQPTDCAGLTGMVPARTAELGGEMVVFTTSCCGGSPGGLFVCRPPERGP